MLNNIKIKMPRFLNNFQNTARQIWFVQTFKNPASNLLMKSIIQQNVFNTQYTRKAANIAYSKVSPIFIRFSAFFIWMKFH